MELSIAQTVFLPSIAALALLLSPRGPWCIQRTPAQISPWTACFALPITVVLAMYLVEGTQVFGLTQRWYTLWLVAVTFAGIASLGALPLHMPRNPPTLLAAAALVALLMLRLPNLDSWGARLLLMAVGAIFAGRFAAVSTCMPRASTLVLTTNMGSMAMTLIVAGSLKVGLIALALTVALGGAMVLTLRIRTLVLGGAFAASGIVILVSLAWYGAAYHEGGAIHRIGWAAISCSGVFLCGLPLHTYGRSGQERGRGALIAASSASCMVSVAAAIHALLATASNATDSSAL